VTSALRESFDLPVVDGSRVAEQGQLQGSPLHVAPPWQQGDHEGRPYMLQLPALTPQAEYLLGLALMLFHAPAFARSPNFASLATSWLNAELDTQTIRRGHTLSEGEVIIAPTADLS